MNRAVTYQTLHSGKRRRGRWFHEDSLFSRKNPLPSKNIRIFDRECRASRIAQDLKALAKSWRIHYRDSARNRASCRGSGLTVVIEGSGKWHDSARLYRV